MISDTLHKRLRAAGIGDTPPAMPVTVNDTDPAAAIDQIRPHRHIADSLTRVRESDGEWRDRQKEWAGHVYKLWLAESEALAREWQRKYVDALLYDSQHDTEFASAVYWCYPPGRMRKYETAIADPRTSKPERGVAERMLAQQAERYAIVERFERLQQ